MAASQLPRVINRGKKPTIKPASWYARPDLLAQILGLLTPIEGSRGKAFKWMEQGNVHFGGMAPIDLVDTDEGAERIANYIRRNIAGTGEAAG